MRDFVPRLLAALFVLGAGACTEDPSFRMRWTLAGEALKESFQCSDKGVLTIASLTYDPSGQLVDVRRFPCFPGSFENPDGSVTGPTLPEGPYAVQIVGTNRAFALWIDEVTLEQERISAQLAGTDYDSDPRFDTCTALAESPRCRPETLACDCKHVDVREDTTVDLGIFELSAPPECRDGIDNDRDGLVDDNDPACGDIFSLDTREGRSVAATEVDLRLSFLGANTEVECREVGVRRFEVRVQDRVLAETSGCDLGLRFSAVFDAADADGPAVDGLLPLTLTVHALGDDGEPVAEPAEVPVQVPETLGGFLVLQADFPAEAFFEPIVAPSRLILGYQPFEGAPLRYCNPPPNDGGSLSIATVRVAVLDAHGRPLDPPLALTNGPVLDGSPLDCVAGTLVTEPLVWGEYLVAVEALSPEGEVCFSNLDAPARAAPEEPVTVALPRVSASGSCSDCQGDAECGTSSCVDGVCRP